MTDKCSDCGGRCSEDAILLEWAGRKLPFCSFECLIMHSVASVRRRIARRQRKAQRYALANRRCDSSRSRRAAKVRLQL